MGSAEAMTRKRQQSDVGLTVTCHVHASSPIRCGSPVDRCKIAAREHEPAGDRRALLFVLLDSAVDHFDRPLNLDDGPDRVLGDLTRTRDGLSPSAARVNKSRTRFFQIRKMVMSH